MFIAKTFKDFVGLEEINKIINYLEITKDWRVLENSIWNNRTIPLNSINTSEIQSIIKKIVLKIQKIISKEYDIGCCVYADSIDLCRWFAGTEQPPHCDDMSNIQNQFIIHGHRKFGSIIYLNSDYGGGRTYYPDYGFEIVPEVGKLAIHPADCIHKHGVTKIQNNTRYTIACFWTFDINKANKFIEW
jgi:hypothetical protein